MELRHLRYFVAVAEELNYRKAAERLHVAQPALSSQIQDLEAELGVRLLDRNTAGVRLTDAGAAFLEETRLTLAQAQQAMTIAREAAKGRRGRLTIGYSGPLLMGFIPDTLKSFHAKFPDVDAVLVEMPIGDQMAALESGALHIAFAIAGSAPIPAGLQSVEVIRSPVRVAVGRSHRLAKATRISLADLVHENLFCVANKRGSFVHGALMRRNFTLRGLKPASTRPIEGVEAFRAMLESGLGVSLVPEMGGLARSPDLVFKPLKDIGDDLVLKLNAVWPEGQTSLLTRNFIELLGRVKHAGKTRANKS